MFKNILKLIILDQVTKLIIISIEKIQLIKNFIFFEFYGSGRMHFYNIKILILLFIILIFVLTKVSQHRLLKNGIILLIAGVFSNLFDFLLRGFVIDWINIYFFFALNIADIYIISGILYLILFIIELFKSDLKLN